MGGQVAEGAAGGVAVGRWVGDCVAIAGSTPHLAANHPLLSRL